MQIWKRSPPTPAPGGASSNERWRCDLFFAPFPQRRSRAGFFTRQVCGSVENPGALRAIPIARYLIKRRSLPPKLRFGGNSRPASTDGGDAGDAPAGSTDKKTRECPLCDQMGFVLRAIASAAHRAAQRYAPLPSVSTEASSKFWPVYRGVDNHEALPDAELSPPAAVAFEDPIVLPRLLAVLRGMRRSVRIKKRIPRTPALGVGASDERWRYDRFSLVPNGEAGPGWFTLQVCGSLANRWRLTRDTHCAAVYSRPQSPDEVACLGP